MKDANIIKINPADKQLKVWADTYVPERDIFFLRDQDLQTFGHNLTSVLVMPRDEFIRHSSYSSIQSVNSYETFWVLRDAKYVIIAQPVWIGSLSGEDRIKLLSIQRLLGRGLILPISYFPDPEILPKEFIIIESDQPYVVLQHEMWQGLPYDMKAEALKAYSAEWDGMDSYEPPANLPVHLKEYANSYPSKSGANCLAAVLYAISSDPVKSKWIIQEWTHQETFKMGLKNEGYTESLDELVEGDVVTWVDSNEVIQHAAYYLGNELFFNKNGQTFFNPWKIVHRDELEEEWGKYTTNAYRRKANFH